MTIYKWFDTLGQGGAPPRLARATRIVLYQVVHALLIRLEIHEDREHGLASGFIFFFVSTLSSLLRRDQP
jgi:hypothetical protein